MSDTSIAPLLEIALAQTNSHGVYVYRFNTERDGFDLAASSGLPHDQNSVRLNGEALGWFRTSASLVILSEEAHADWRYQNFPEFQRHRFEALVSVPLIEGGLTVGVANICRSHAGSYGGREAQFLGNLGLPLAALLSGSEERRKLETEVDSLSQKLAERKLLDRAKGMLQATQSWTEEQAYLYLRRTSRRRRTPMVTIAREVIDTRAANLL